MRPKKLSAYINRGDTYRLMNKNESAEKDYRLGLILFRGNPKEINKLFGDNPRKRLYDLLEGTKHENGVNDYKWAIRTERGLVKLGFSEQGIEKEALEKGIVTQEQLERFYQHEK